MYDCINAADAIPIHTFALCAYHVGIIDGQYIAIYVLGTDGTGESVNVATLNGKFDDGLAFLANMFA